MSEHPYYRKHVFFCTRERSSGACCMNQQSGQAQKHAEDLIKTLDLKGKGKVRVNQTGCLGRCEEGPLLVIYPEGRWYRYQNMQDVEEIIRSDVVAGVVVDRLKI
jgi:(2Fe-2S) ferredoxin